MALRCTIPEMREMAKKSGLSTDQYMDAISIYEEYQEKAHSERSANLDDKVLIDNYLNSLNGALSEDLSAAEMLVAANVRHNQGTSAYVRRGVKKLLQLRDMRTKKD